ncbi:succinate dehydrogenase cytochrome b subunit [Neolewinella agarilytica]|uniref:Succinate dehydrogenase / fumarate reductase cytochrome b subunit n=1 Tax=Neolewinella agarilytica TaxID=478744 RepID=A0A1H9EAI1_9BACT|nr:succinate dehydrogenase cytochrome b subunit [Neolewinella agarilytica]SEQ22597.1 succinate dehydrogenase / fumarate reductase cytochrome b subunit [Neolewinella agarilytica]
MNTWFGRFITSSIGKKVVMALTGLFLITFLIVHLVGNLQLLSSGGGQAFNEYAYFMTHNPLIKFTSYGLYAFILIHAFQGIALWLKNRSARGSQGYAVKVNRTAGASKASVRMGALGTIILVFILLHMYQFWLQMKLGNTAMIGYDGGEQVKDLYSLVKGVYANPVFVVIYVISMIVIGFHLWHGFESAFQTLGLNHPKWTPLIKFVGRTYSVLVPLGFAIIPIWMYLAQQ